MPRSVRLALEGGGVAELKIGIVGHEQNKFTRDGRQKARDIIFDLTKEHCTVISGHCHLGGVDIWAEEIAQARGRPLVIHAPTILKWDGGYKQRNLKIAEDSDIVHVIVVREYPENWTGYRCKECYHCRSARHVKSGACWTAWKAIAMGKEAVWHIV